MKRLLLLATTLILSSCGGAKTTSTAPQEKSDECVFQDEICKDALDFQGEYEKADEERKESMIVVLNSYIEHCEAARKACKKSMR